MLPEQPYSSTLIDMCPYQASGWKRMKRALIGGFSSLKKNGILVCVSNKILKQNNGVLPNISLALPCSNWSLCKWVSKRGKELSIYYVMQK